jgi:membrane protease YdiL (CAAX protease family)
MVQGACQLAAIEPRSVDATSPLAPPWHTRALVALMLVVAAAGTAFAHVAGPSGGVASPGVTAYLPLSIVNLGLLLYVCRIGFGRNILARVFSQGRYDTPRVLVDLGWGACVALALIGTEKTLQWLFGLPESVAAHALVPRTPGERIAWVFVAALVGFSEELVYRGYLQRQLAALSGWLPFGVVAQALLFGIAHGEQGGWAVARFAGYALGLGWLAAVRKSLLPCVLGHVAVDLLAGLAG